MRVTNVSDEQELHAFAAKAGACFAPNPLIRTYTTDGQITPGELLAIRWGMGDDCVMVVRVGLDEPVVYGQAVRAAA